MFKKIKIKSKIKSLRYEIERIERLRSRSQAALLQAIMSSSEPRDEDVEYFNQYTKQIDELREKLHELQTLVSA